MTVLGDILMVAGTLLALVAIWGVVELVQMARSVRGLSDRLALDLPPLMAKADWTLDAVGAAVARADGVVAQIEEVSDRVSTTTRAAQDFVEGPVAAVSGAADGVRRWMGILLGRRF